MTTAEDTDAGWRLMTREEILEVMQEMVYETNGLAAPRHAFEWRMPPGIAAVLAPVHDDRVFDISIVIDPKCPEGRVYLERIV